MAKWTEKNIKWKPIFECVCIPHGEGLDFVKDGTMKVLTMCQGGNSRSVAAGFLLKYKYNIDAIACSWEKNSPSTLKMLMEWADKIIIMQEEMRQRVFPEYHSKLIVIDVGPDIWCNGLHQDLLQKVDAHLIKMCVPVERNASDSNG